MPRPKSRTERLIRAHIPGLDQEFRWLKGGTWIDLLDPTCDSNPVCRFMTPEEQDGRLNPGASVLRQLDPEV
jgi:hypothetical protein